MMDKNREAFEAEFRRANPHEKHIDMMLEIYDHGTPDCPNIGYYSILARSAWAWWKASRESIEVEINISGERYAWSEGVFNLKEDLTKQFVSLGIRVKGNE